MEAIECEEMLKGQTQAWKHLHSFVDSMILNCAVELRLADIINSHGGPINLSQIASSIHSPSPNIAYLGRIIRFLVHKQILSAHRPSDGGETLYGLTNTSKWLLHDAELSFVPLILWGITECQMAPFHYLSQCVKEGGTCFEKAHGIGLWDLASQDPKRNKLFNDAMACTAKIVMSAFVKEHKECFGHIESLVDVGGGTGGVIAEIVKSNPHIKGINFDLQHVVATAPEYEGVTHVSGDMFQSIPHADAVFMKWILHDWSDEDCIKILKNCRKAIPEKGGKVIIVDIVLQIEGNGLFDDFGFGFDILMFATTSGGKERTELEWKYILEQGGFSHYKIIKIPAITSIIEAYP